MLINLKVKTLDAQTHEFGVDNEITVREFKDKIAERTSIAADQQRIIYCGRVLVDEKQLKDYDVDGKVVHVAERPPPSQRGPSTSSSSNDGNTRERPTPRGMRNSPLFRALDGIVVGTMPIPINASMNNSQVPVNPFTSSSSFCMNRITVARHMLDCVNNIANYLEDPERGLNNTSLDILARGRWTMESTVVEVGITAADLPQNQNIVEMVQGAVSAALRRNGNTNVTVVQLPTVFGSNEGETAPEGAEVQSPTDTMESTASTSDGGHATVIIEDVIDVEEDDGATNAFSSAAQAGSAASNSSATSTGTGTTAATAENANNTNNSTSTGTNTDDNSPRRRTGTSVLAEVVEQMCQVQTRLNPFLEQFYDLLQNEPTFEENDTAGRENAQRLYDRVSEAFHYMSHAQHAISDLMLDVSLPAPRFLTCRPILVEQSGYVSSNNYLSAAGVAVAAAADAMRQQLPQQQTEQTTRSEANHNGDAAAASTPTATTAVVAAPPPTAAAASSTATVGDTVEDPIDDPIVAPNVHPNAAGAAAAVHAANVGTQSNDNHQMQMARLIQAVVNSAPIDTEFHVQINAPSIVSFGQAMNAAAAAATQGQGQAERSQTQQQTAENATTSNDGANNNNNNDDNNATDSNESASASANTSPSAAGTTAPNQARVTTATLPTTSTQTRSTSRPQLQIGNLPAPGWNGRFIPANMMSSFDRFLPCNSHHIREANGENGANGNGTGVGSRTSMSAAHAHNRAMANTANRRTLRTLTDLMQRIRPSLVGSTMTTPNGSAPLQAAPPANNIHALRNLLRQSNTFGALVIDSNQITTTQLRRLRQLRRQLNSFVNEHIFEGNPINIYTIPLAVNRSVRWFGDSLLYLPQYEKPEYDSRNSLFNILRSMLPLFINLLTDNQESPVQFEQRLKQICEQFMTRLYSVLCVCVGRSNAEMYWGQLIRLLLVPVRSNFTDETLEFLCEYLNPEIPTNTDTVDAQQFIVGRDTSQCGDNFTPMDMDVVEEAKAEVPSTSDTNECASSSQLILDDMELEEEIEVETTPAEPAAAELFPNVVAGSEPWHRNFPNDPVAQFPNWLPIITRDIQTQAENTSTQAPFSDAYISGMSAKRRKLIQSTKAPTEVRSLVADSVRKAIQVVGVTTSTASNQSQNPDEITNAISNDSAVQASLTEAIRTNVRERLKNEPDYKAEKYPQTAKFVNK